MQKDAATDFPRGGRNLLSRREEEEIRAGVDAELEGGRVSSTRKVRAGERSVWRTIYVHFLAIVLLENYQSTPIGPRLRALQTINFREEQEKMNIWVAYFNLENEYGHPAEEVVVKTFQRALQYCDPKRLHISLLGIYERTNQRVLAEKLVDSMVKKFKSSCKVWLKKVESFLKQEKDDVQSAINRALVSLPRRKHIKFISRAALLEFKCGVPDRGRSMFEGMLRENPKRTDLWSIYLDQEIRLADVEVATCLSLPPKKMKFLFKKYLEYEKLHGEEDRIEYVKMKAMEYVESSLS